MSKLQIRFVPLVFALAASCAGYRVQPIGPLGADWPTASEGYVVYEPVPYLQVTVMPPDGGTQSVTTEIVYLPNMKRPYRVSTYSYLASADFKMTYKDGWMLTGVESSVDTTAVAKALIDAAAGKVLRIPAGKGALEPGIHYYRIDAESGAVTPAFQALFGN